MLGNFDHVWVGTYSANLGRGRDRPGVSGGYAALRISLTAGNSTEEDHRCDWQDNLMQSLQASL